MSGGVYGGGEPAGRAEILITLRLAREFYVCTHGAGKNLMDGRKNCDIRIIAIVVFFQMRSELLCSILGQTLLEQDMQERTHPR